MSGTSKATRRQFLQTSLAAATVAAPTLIPARAMGADDAEAPSERITLGVIGMGPRCNYDIQPMLAMSDVQCVMIADVQRSRRDAGKALVDKAYGNSDCKIV